MGNRYALVLDREAATDPIHWRISQIADRESEIRLQHDGHVIIRDRNPGDRVGKAVTVTDVRTQVQDNAHIIVLP